MARVHGLHEVNGWWVFTWHSNDFWNTLHAVKHQIPSYDRSYNEETEEWSVKAGPYDALLAMEG